MKKKITVILNLVIIMYGLGVCVRIKKVIDVIVSVYKKKKYDLFNDY